MSLNFQTTYQVENFILNTQWESFPEEVQKRAVVCGIDLMTALLLGSHGQQFRIGMSMARKFYKQGDVPIVGTKETFGLLGAVVAMSHASNSFDIDDGHNMIKGHPGTSFIAGLMAASLLKNLTYKEYLTTMVICYEVAIRAGIAIQDYYGFLHSTGTYGAVGTAAAIARNFNFSKEQVNTALSIAEFHAPLTPVMFSVEYPSMNKDGVPFGALVGAEAALETKEGSTGVGYILELPKYNYLTDSLGKTFEILNLYFKPYTCCRWAHQPIKACIDLENNYVFGADDVQEVIVHTFDSAARLSKIIPKSTDEAQYNIAWPVAAAIVHKDVGLTQVWEPALSDSKVQEIMKKLSFVVDAELDAQFPAKRQAWVEIKLKDGRVLKSDVYEAPGERTDYVDLNWITNKFIKRTSPILSADQQNIVLNLLTQNTDEKLTYIVDKINSF
jgi:2-methylcitrate dehydratase PrpD